MSQALHDKAAELASEEKKAGSMKRGSLAALGSGTSGQSVKERMAALQGSSRDSGLASPKSPSSPKPVGGKGVFGGRKDSPGGGGAKGSPGVNAVEPTGTELHAGWLKRGGTGVLAAAYTRRYVVLFSEPTLAFYEDDARSKLKNTWVLEAGTRVTPSSNNDATIETPSAEGKPRVLRLRSTVPSEGPTWWTAIQMAVANAPTPSAPPDVPDEPDDLAAAVEALHRNSISAPPHLADEPPAHFKKSRSSMPQSTGQLMGGVELGGAGGLPTSPALSTSPTLQTVSPFGPPSTALGPPSTERMSLDMSMEDDDDELSGSSSDDDTDAGATRPPAHAAQSGVNMGRRSSGGVGGGKSRASAARRRSLAKRVPASTAAMAALANALAAMEAAIAYPAAFEPDVLQAASATDALMAAVLAMEDAHAPRPGRLNASEALFKSLEAMEVAKRWVLPHTPPHATTLRTPSPNLRPFL